MPTMSFFSPPSSSSSNPSPLASPQNSSSNGNGTKNTMKKSKNIIITGGARGIGRVMARHFLSSPAQQNRVFLIDVDAGELAHCVSTHLAQHVDGEGRLRVQGFVADMRDPAQIHAAVHAAAAWFPGGRVDVLVNNAGIGPFWSGGRTMEDPATAGEWASVLATNLSGPFLASQAVIPFMKTKKRGHSDEDDIDGSSNSSATYITANGAGSSSEDDKEKVEKDEEDTKVDKEEDAKTGISAAINGTMDTIADAFKTTMNLDEKTNGNGSDDTATTTAIATAATTTATTAANSSSTSSSRGSSPNTHNNNNNNNNNNNGHNGHNDNDNDEIDDEAIFTPGPSIIHISSFRAHRSDPNSEAYAATKAGLIGLTHAMAVSAQQWGIRVNAISPGFISVCHECRAGDEKKGSGATWAGRHAPHEHALFPAGRVGRGEDIAEAVEYLVGAGYISEF